LRIGRQSWVAAFVVMGVFLLGAASGVLGASILAHRHLRTMFEGTEEEVDTRLTLTLLDSVLRLSADEHQKVRAILDTNAVEHTRLRETIEPGLTALRAKERAEIHAVLTPAQQARLDEILTRMDQRRARIERFLDH
jgi:hypothetical protein